MCDELEHTETKLGEARRRPFQFGLGTLFLVTTVFAIASAGFAKSSLHGAFGALLGAWITLIGSVCIWGAVVERFRTWILELVVGIAFFCLGAAMWALCVF